MRLDQIAVDVRPVPLQRPGGCAELCRGVPQWPHLQQCPVNFPALLMSTNRT
jgi:hypothetical protein